MKKITLILAATLMLSAVQAHAEQYRVVGVMDGDTIRVLKDRSQMKCRLSAVDAPEKNQPYGQQSKKSLSDMVFNKMVEVNVVDHDQYGRSVCVIALNGVDINKAQVQRGMAWWYRKYSKDASYGHAESAARHQRVGLWADANPTPPWAFRRTERSTGFR